MLIKRFLMAITAIALLSISSSIFVSPVLATSITRTEILHAYLKAHGSPAADNAVDFVEAADKYNLDWRFVAAISGVESTYCKFVPGGVVEPYTSHNCWGWGVYGTQAIYFKSWKEGIYTVSQGLKENYIDKGLTNPLTINRVYAASPTWGSKVIYILQDIDNFEQQYQKANAQASVFLAQTQIAGSSAMPVSSL